MGPGSDRITRRKTQKKYTFKRLYGIIRVAFLNGGDTMKSIRKKLILSILLCSLVTAVLIGILAIWNSVRTAGSDAMENMQLTGEKV